MGNVQIETIEEHKVFDGTQYKFRHYSTLLNCSMTFSLFLPNKEIFANPPLLWWLSGLTCTDDNFTHKAGAQKVAAKKGLALIMPDTSPRGTDVPNDDAWDLGQGAGFYLNATEEPWQTHYKMYDYITEELTGILRDKFNLTGPEAIAGHSMGGHGALVIGLRNPKRFRSISAFAPIVNPSEVPWGIKAFSTYLGQDKTTWSQWDAVELLAAAPTGETSPILISQGESDPFYKEQLQPEKLQTVAQRKKIPLTLKLEPEFDHSYYFVSTYIEEHIEFHLQHLKK